jgi:hypothetical protein
MAYEVTFECANCKRALAWQVPGEDYSICSSDYHEDLTVCLSCLIEHCCTTNCFECPHGDFPIKGVYPDCEWLWMKKHYMEDEKED